MIVIDLKDIIMIIIFIVIAIIFIIKIIIEKIQKIGKKNCYECKYYKLYDVCSFGDGCRYQCKKNNRIDDIVSMNCDEHFEKCKEIIGESDENNKQ